MACAKLSERWIRRGALALSALIRLLLYSIDRIFRDKVPPHYWWGSARTGWTCWVRIFFEYKLKPRLEATGRGKMEGGAGAR
ncbi:MAG: hypothetical protein IPG76_23930 [Acidobacteria bacterium]|nr:hypothetical protein [Acidobacteriota bacterium]